MAEDKGRSRLIRWIVAVVYTALIFAYAWLVMPTWNWLTDTFGVERAGVLVDRVVPVVGIILAIPALIVLSRRRPSAWLWLAGVVAGYAYLLTLHAEYPVERIHLIQYSLVAWLYFRALRLDLSQPVSYLGAALAVFLVGTIDESLQAIIPNRSRSMEDMILNWAAGGLGLVGLMALQRDGMSSWFPARGRLVRFAFGFTAPILIAAFLGHQVWTRYLYPPLNLLIITVDCARADRMGFNGYERNTTEYLDALARNGAVFTNTFSQAAWTGPGVVSTLSGLYPPTHGVTAAGRTIPEVAETVLDGFRERGYRVPNMSYLTQDQTFMNLGATEPSGFDVSKGEVSVIRNWIGEHHREPFAIWYHWRNVHLPYNPPPRHRVWPPANDPNRPLPPVIKDTVQHEVIVPLGTAEFSESDKPWLDSIYDAQIRQFDHAFESIRYKLALHHKLKHTIIVITADHGEELLEHGFIGHGSTAVHSRHYDEHLHIPLLIYAPRVIKNGTVIDTIAEQVDILPTVYDMMGWKIPEEVQGRSLLPAIRGESIEEKPTFAESIEGGYQSKPHQMDEFLRSIRTDEWKFIARMSAEGDEFELYNLAEDPGEKRNVFEKHPAIAGDFISQLAQWITRNQDARIALEERQQIKELRRAAMDPANLEVPVIEQPKDGETIYYETDEGKVHAKWTGNPHAEYIIEYDVGESWHRLKGKYPVPPGNEQIFGPLPKDGWKPLHQWNPYRLRIRPRGLPDGWSDWITVYVAPLGEGEESDSDG